MGAELTNLDGFGNELPAETQEQQPLEQPVEDSGEEQFYESRIDEINRDDLSPQMQVVYDRLLEERSNMQSGFTQSMQRAAEVRRDADTWRMVQQNPELLSVMNEAIYNLDRGLPARGAQQQQQQPQETPDPNTDPMGFLDNQIETTVRSLLQEYLPPLQQGLQQVTGFVNQNQARLEFDNLTSKFPSAKAVGMENLNAVRSRYRDNAGRPVSMETALAIYSQESGNPAIMQPLQRQQARPTPKVPPVEQPRQQRGSTANTPPPEGIRRLQDEVAKRQKDGTIASLKAAVDRALNR